MCEYDEHRILRGYILTHYPHLQTEPEWRRIGKTMQLYKEDFRNWIRALGPARSEPGFLYPPMPEFEWPAGYFEFLDTVVGRILREHGPQLIINRCPICDRIRRTPRAKICYWCNHSQYTSGRVS